MELQRIELQRMVFKQMEVQRMGVQQVGLQGWKDNGWDYRGWNEDLQTHSDGVVGSRELAHLLLIAFVERPAAPTQRTTPPRPPPAVVLVPSRVAVVVMVAASSGSGRAEAHKVLPEGRIVGYAGRTSLAREEPEVVGEMEAARVLVQRAHTAAEEGDRTLDNRRVLVQ